MVGSAEIEALVAFHGRGPGTDAERRAAEHLAGRLRALGRDAAVEPVAVWPDYARAHMVHALLAIAGSVLSVPFPAGGAVLAFLALASALGDLTGSFFLIRRLTGRRASQNVTSAELGDKPGTLILTAHYDAARSGSIFNRRLARAVAALGRLVRRPLSLAGPFLWSIAIVFVCAGLRALELEPPALAAIQFVPTAVLIAAVALLAEVQVAPFSPGANDNASGVATALLLAERFGGTLQHFDVWALLPGSHEGMSEGMRRWLRGHQTELDRERTVFLNLDEVGVGDPRYSRREGLLFTSAMNRALVDLCERIAADDDLDATHGARACVSRRASDALAARDAGYPAITVLCQDADGLAPDHHLPSDSPARIEEEALERAFAFCTEFIERLDVEIGPILAAGATGR